MARPDKNPVLIGQKFGRLTVIGKTFSVVGKKQPKNLSASFCVCDCNSNRTLTVLDISLKNKKTQSCGCLKIENMSKTGKYNTKHGLSVKSNTHRAYVCWQQMKVRCFNINAKNYYRYGGRGITVCDRWKDSFENFWEDMGPTWKKGLSIERINNDGNYEPSNCKWATAKEQANNRNQPKLRTRSDNKTGITGVSKHKSGNWIITLTDKKVTYTRDFFEACCIRKSYELNRRV